MQQQNEHRVSVQYGVYTFVDTGRQINVLRQGQPWEVNLSGSAAILPMMCELDAARVVLKEVRSLVSSGACNESKDGVIWRLRRVLEHHAALCGDNTEPSEWCDINLDTHHGRGTDMSTEPCPKQLPENFDERFAKIVEDTLANSFPAWNVKIYREVCQTLTKQMLKALKEVV